MAKRNKGNHVGIVVRRQLLNIARHLEIEAPAMMGNRTLVAAIAGKRSIVLGNENKRNVETILAWFHRNENAALKSPRRERRVKMKASKAGATSAEMRDLFYRSWEWRTLRMEVLKAHGARCQCCGAGRNDFTSAGDPVRICVDHIKPISKFWHLRLDKKNLQVLCDECNQGKGAWDETDWREEAANDDSALAQIREQLRYSI